MSRRPPPELEATHEVLREGPVRLAVHRDWTSILPLASLLAGAPLASCGESVPHDLVGRGAIDVLATAGGELVVKRLTRGGLAAGITPDLFADPWRPAREAWLAEALAARGCPTPAVVVARAVAVGAGLHRLDLATARVPGAVDLLEASRRGDPPRELGELTGRTLRGLHDAGLRHRDLQVKNLLVPAAAGSVDRAPVIDLDRCRLGAPLTDEERVRSLARFGRSLVKRGVLPRRRGEGGDDAARAGLRGFWAGYGDSGSGSRRGLLERVARRLAREVTWHAWRWDAG